MSLFCCKILVSYKLFQLMKSMHSWLLAAFLDKFSCHKGHYSVEFFLCTNCERVTMSKTSGDSSPLKGHIFLQSIYEDA